MMWPATEQFVKFRTMPVVRLAECAVCGARFAFTIKRALCWKHYEMMFGSVPQHEITNEVTAKLPAVRRR